MTNDPYVLIVSTRPDTATDSVVRHLTDRGIAHYRLNTEDYPFQHTMAYVPGTGTPRLNCNSADLPVPSSIWYRRLRTPATPDSMDEGIAIFCRQETRAALLGSIIGRCTRWMSHPSAIWQAELKPHQLDI
ncbi:MAG: hypothetical protein NTW28_25050, partial [Candidatus Solibacter sp.]|nr:hypothetical protein [Candidatus Solibacter sp.]